MIWRLVLTKPSRELVVAGDLSAAGHDSLCLWYRGEVRHARKVTPVRRAYYPRYIFARAPVEIIRSTWGVSDIVRSGDQLAPVPEKVIEEVRALGNQAQMVEMAVEEARKRFVKGDRAIVRGGPFMGLKALVELDNGKEIKAWLHAFRGRVLTTFDLGDLEAVSP